EQPAAPQDQGGAPVVGARGPGAQGQAGGEQDESGGEQPGDLTALGVVEHAGETGLAPDARTAGRRTAAGAGAAVLVTVEPAQAVVAEGEFDDRIVLRAADPRPRIRGPQLHRQQPPAR